MMNRLMESQTEIESIRPRTLTLNLSDADVLRLSVKAGADGLSVAGLVENFIADLVCGTQTHGSDERDLAEQWFERCGFGMLEDQTFARYLLGLGGATVKDVLELWREIKDLDNDIAYLIDNPAEAVEDEVEGLKESRRCSKDQFDDYWGGYLKQYLGSPQPDLEVEMITVVAWWKSYKQLLGA